MAIPDDSQIDNPEKNNLDDHQGDNSNLDQDDNPTVRVVNFMSFISFAKHENNTTKQ